jgi:MYXO-CTERM domain-containing protein
MRASLALTRELFEEASHVTRMYTTISPDEMLEDPAFDFNPELPDVDNQHIAEQLLECNADDWTIVLPQGMEITGIGNVWPITMSDDMPANLRILQMSTVGDGMEVEDNAEKVAALLIDLGVGEATEELTDPGSSTSDTHNGSDDGESDDDSSGSSADDEESSGDGDTEGDAGADSVDSAASDDDGCGCRAVGTPNPSGGTWRASLLVLTAALLRRRRQMSERRSRSVI